MTLRTGTLQGVSLVAGDPSSTSGYKTYLLTYSFPAYTGSGDSATVLDCAGAISTRMRDGKTRAMVAGVIPQRAGSGVDTAGQLVYVGTCVLAGTSSITDLTFNLTDSAQVELTSSTASSGVPILVQVLET